MAQKQPLQFNFSGGLELKTDPKQIPAGKFLQLQNSVFDKGGLLKKRNGFQQLTILPTTSASFLTTFNNNLTAISNVIEVYSKSNVSWLNKGNIQPVSLNTLPLVRSNTSQTQVDIAIADNGLACIAYTDQNQSNLTQPVYKYTIIDPSTGQSILAPHTLTATGAPRVFALKQWFLVIYTNVNALNCVAISTGSLVVQSVFTIANPYQPSTGLSFDGVVAFNNLYLGFSSTSGGQNIHFCYINQQLQISSFTNFPNIKATLIGLTADSSNIWAATYDSTSSTGYAMAINSALQVTQSPVEVISSGSINNITLTVLNGTCTVYYEINNVYSYDSALPSNYIQWVQLSIANPTPTIPSVVIRSVGLASKAFIVNNTEYFLAAYTSQFQPTYFLINATQSTSLSPTITAKLAYQNGGGYLSNGLPNVVVSGNTASTGYLYKDLIQSVNKNTNLPSGSQVDGIYSQTGANLVNFSFEPESTSVEIASALHLTGGFLWEYDGYAPVEHNFFLYPDDVEGIGSNTGGAMVPQQYYYQVVYEWTDNQGNIHRSAPSIPNLVDMSTQNSAFQQPALVITTGSWSASATTMTVGSENNLQLLQYATDLTTLGNIPINTQVVGISGSDVAVDTTLPSAVTDDNVLFAGGVTTTASGTSGNNFVAVFSTVGVEVGMTVIDQTANNIPSYTYVTSISGPDIFLSNTLTGTFTSDNLLFTYGNLFTGTGVYGSSQIIVNNSGNLKVGQVVNDLTTIGAISANTYITSIVGNIVTLSSPLNSNLAADLLSVASVCSVTLNIPTLRLTYKTANPVKITIYRWSTSQQNYYEVTSILQPILNSTTTDSITYIDTQADNQILGNQLIYTTGGVVEDVNAPSTSITTLWQTRLWLVDNEDQNLLWFSKQVIENTPVEMSDLFTLYVAPTIGASGSTGPITGLAAMDSYLIIFKKDALYYVTGTGPDNTGANNQFTDPTYITSTVGCVNTQSIILTPMGLMFQSDKGIWLLDRGLTTQYIGAPIESIALSSNVLSAVLVPGTNQVRFDMDNGMKLMYDYYYQQWGTFIGCPGISSCIYGSLHTYLDSFGRVFQENPGSYVDGENPVLLGFQTGWLNLAGIQGYQRIYEFGLLGTYYSPHTLQLGIAYDYAASSQQVEVMPSNFTGVYGSDSLYGQTTPYGGPGNLEQWRIHTSQQKCQVFQITLQEVYDPSYQTLAGAGFTLSGVNCVIGTKKAYRPYTGSNSAG